MTYKFHLDIKSLRHFHVKTTSWSLHHCSMRLQPIVGLKQVLGGLPGRLLPDFSGGGVRGGYLNHY